MPVKKKKGAKKKGKKGTKAKKEPEEKKNIYEIPEYIDPALLCPKVDLHIRLAQPVSDYFSFKITVPISTQIEEIKQKIEEMHDHSVNNINVCINRYMPEEVVDPSKCLSELGVTTGGEVKIYYDYDPVSHPLLIT